MLRKSRAVLHLVWTADETDISEHIATDRMETYISVFIDTRLSSFGQSDPSSSAANVNLRLILDLVTHLKL